MISFKQFISEADQRDLDSLKLELEKHCRKAISDFNSADVMLFRGVQNDEMQNAQEYLYEDLPFKVSRIKTRTDRAPKDTPRWAHDAANEIFDEQFGIKLRSSSVFCFSSLNPAMGYGSACAIFPIGDYHIYQSPTISDLTVQLFPDRMGENVGPVGGSHLYDEEDEDDISREDQLNMLHQIVSSGAYQKDDLKLLKSKPRYEVMLQCSEYYAVSLKDLPANGIPLLKFLKS